MGWVVVERAWTVEGLRVWDGNFGGFHAEKNTNNALHRKKMDFIEWLWYTGLDSLVDCVSRWCNGYVECS
jgi:hypothetical protein